MAEDTGGWDYVALEPIDYQGVRAYNPGDLVHVDNVNAHGYLEDKLVAKRETKAAKAAQTPTPAAVAPAHTSA